MKAWLATAMFSSLVMQASAQGFGDGIYVASPELCEKARTDGLDSVLDEGKLILSSYGLEGYEYNCEFLQVMESSRASGWVATALCEEPDHAFPDTIAIMPRGEGELELTSIVPEDDDGGGGGNSGLYVLCEGVTPP